MLKRRICEDKEELLQSKRKKASAAWIAYLAT